MGKIALLVPREEMVYKAHNILQEKGYRDNQIEIVCMKVVRTQNAVMEARQAIAKGASIIIARGLQALLIKQYTDIPVIEIVITAQEMALLVMKAKQILKKEHPVIGVVGFENMFCDMSYFESIYDIELRTFYAPDNDRLKPCALQAVEEKVDLVIGGDVAVETAAAAGVASLFLSTTEDSIRNAFSMAKRISFAMDVEKKRAAQLETLLDNSFSGVANTDSRGRITAVNPLMEDMLGLPEKKLSGHRLTEVFPDLDKEQAERVLSQGGEGYSAFLQLKGTSVFAVLAPVLVEGQVEGAMLTCHKMKRRLTAEQDSRQKRHSSGLIALGQFPDLFQESEAMKACIRQARLYALSDMPVLIEGEPGTEKRLLAQSIHNASLRNRNAFADVSLKGLSDEEQFVLLFDENGAAVQADGGSLLLEEGEYLSTSNQYRLLQLLRYRLRCGRQLKQNRYLDVRVMLSAGEPGALQEAAMKGEFRKDLYYLLCGLNLKIPPVRERREDLKLKLELSIRESCERYGRYHVLTREAMKLLLQYPWPGNLFQVETFCERLILTASSRSLDERAIQRLLDELFGWENRKEPYAGKDEDALGHNGQQRPGKARGEGLDERGKHLVETLRKCGGNRQKTAEELGISKATLWRWMKKYGV